MLNRTASILIITMCVVFILIYLKDILIPFVLAVLIWFLIKEVNRFTARLKLKGRPLPSWIRSIVSFCLIFGVLGLVVSLLTSNIREINEVIPTYQEKLKGFEASIEERFAIDISDELGKIGGSLDLGSMVGSLFNTLTSLFGNAFMILIYVAFLLFEESLFRPKLKAMFSESRDFKSASTMLSRINKSMGDYISLKTIVSLITGFASYVVLIIIGVDFAFFWAFLIFLLNYIPTIGSLLGTLFPALIALLQFDTYGPALLVLFLVGVIQVLVGNVLEPKMMGNSLNVSPLVVILSLTFWGFIWGVVGMILSVPITVMLVIVFSQFDITRPIAVMLSDKGMVDT